MKFNISRRFSLILLSAFFISLTNTSFAFPETERLPANNSAPLEILSQTPKGALIITEGEFKNKLAFTWSGASLTALDLETWDLATTQPDSFSSDIADVAILADHTTLVIALTSGDLATIDLTDLESYTNTVDPNEDDPNEDLVNEDDDSRLIDTSKDMDDPGISAMAVHPHDDDQKVYLISENDQTYYEVNLNSKTITDFISFIPETVNEDQNTTNTDEEPEYTPVDIAFADSAQGERIVISTQDGEMLVGLPGEFDFEVTTLSVRNQDSELPQLTSIHLTPNGEFAYVLDDTNDLIWVFDILTQTFRDQIISETSLDPLDFDNTLENVSLSDITFLEDTDSEAITGYVSGDLGVSLIDASNPDQTDDTKSIDTEANTDTTSIFEPIELSKTPVLLKQFSQELATVLSFNADSSISILSDNPFVSITESSQTTVTLSQPEFTLTFQSDEAGTYTVYANSDPLQESGTELISTTTLDSANTDTTTATLSIADLGRDILSEGENKFYVFVSDINGHRGWDAQIILIDRPPESVEIESLQFGNQKIHVRFATSPDNDIDHYSLFAVPATNQSSSDCSIPPSTETIGTVIHNVSSSSCESSSCSTTITGLENNIAYCVGIRVSDQSAQTSSLGFFLTAETPETTVGPAQFLGQTSCSLQTQSTTSSFTWFWIVLFVPFFIRFKNNILILASGLFLFCFISPKAEAKDTTPQHWSVEVRATHWFPTQSDVKVFLGGCCNFLGEVEAGYFFTPQMNITIGSGFGYRSNEARSLNSNEVSGDRFKLWSIPLRADFIYRFDFQDEQFFVPFLRAGFDSVLFREYGLDEAILANKFGVHAGLGMSFLLDKLESLTPEFENEKGINDVYLVLEGRFSTINSFSSSGMDFSGFYTSLGLLFLF